MISFEESTLPDYDNSTPEAGTSRTGIFSSFFSFVNSFFRRLFCCFDEDEIGPKVRQRVTVSSENSTISSNINPPLKAPNQRRSILISETNARKGTIPKRSHFDEKVEYYNFPKCSKYYKSKVMVKNIFLLPEKENLFFKNLISKLEAKKIITDQTIFGTDQTGENIFESDENVILISQQISLVAQEFDCLSLDSLAKILANFEAKYNFSSGFVQDIQCIVLDDLYKESIKPDPSPMLSEGNKSWSNINLN